MGCLAVSHWSFIVQIKCWSGGPIGEGLTSQTHRTTNSSAFLSIIVNLNVTTWFQNYREKMA